MTNYDANEEAAAIITTERVVEGKAPTKNRIRIVVEEYREAADEWEERQDYIVEVEPEIDGYQLAIELSDHATTKQRIVRSLLKVAGDAAHLNHSGGQEGTGQ